MVNGGRTTVGYRVRTDERYPVDPYPGARPDFSYAHVDATVTPLSPDPTADAGWRIADTGEDLDAWLAGRHAVPRADRFAVLVYGSNACPAKLTWLRRNLGLAGAVVVLRARCVNLAAVWAYGTRRRDGQRPATLTAMPGVVEYHAVWLADRDQVGVLNVCEGRGVRYDLVRLGSGRVETEDGTVWDRPLTYTAAGALRRPLLVEGSPVRCADITQTDAVCLRGEPAEDDGLDVSPSVTP